MNYPFYTDKPVTTQEPIALPVLQRRNKPEYYLPDKGLIDAVNISLLLTKPLLLTGEAGVGKTQLAYHLAHQLKLEEPLKFETKSISVARDLFYNYDYLKHFYAAQTKTGSQNSFDYITYQALGLAILLTKTPDEIKCILPKEINHTQAKRSIVLIDEIDKAPRDFPNDILNELENLYFRMPEFDNIKIEANQELYPIIVLTSNSEKHLPDAFLRRCIYYNVPFPDENKLMEITAQYFGKGQFLEDAINLFQRLRKSNFRKKPATAELLDWLDALKIIFKDSENPLRERKALIEPTLTCLAKTTEDIEIAKDVLKKW